MRRCAGGIGTDLWTREGNDCGARRPLTLDFFLGEDCATRYWSAGGITRSSSWRIDAYVASAPASPLLRACNWRDRCVNAARQETTAIMLMAKSSRRAATLRVPRRRRRRDNSTCAYREPNSDTSRRHDAMDRTRAVKFACCHRSTESLAGLSFRAAAYYASAFLCAID